MEYTVVVLLSLLTGGATIGNNKAIKIENIQDVCAIMNRTSHYYERTLPGSTCVYSMNSSNACENCLKLNCSIVASSKFQVILSAKINLLPCYNGNLNVPIHAIAVHILDASGQQIFGKQSTQSFVESFEVKVLGLSVVVDVTANIDNRGDGIFAQVNLSSPTGSFKHEVFPATFIPIQCIEVDRSICFGSLSSESSTPTPMTTNAWTTKSMIIAPTTVSAETAMLTSSGTPMPLPQTVGTPSPTPDEAGSPTCAAAVWTVLLLTILSLASLC